LDDGGVAGWTAPMVAVDAWPVAAAAAAAVAVAVAVHGGLRSCRSPASTGRCRRSDDVSRGIRDVDAEHDGGAAAGGGGVETASALAGGGWTPSPQG